MRIPTNHAASLPQRAFGSQTPSTAASPRAARPTRQAPSDGFESPVSSRRAASAAAVRQPEVRSLLQEQFSSLAADPRGFHETMGNVFGQGYDRAQAEQYRQQALAGDFGWMPKVEWVDAQVLQGGHGAYDAGSGTVLLNRELQGDPALAATTYVEEAGHHLDAQLNTVDSQGDEGELFRRVLGGETLSQAQVAELRAENDKGTIQLHGRDVEVEFRRNFFQRIGQGIRNTIDDVGDAIRNTGEAVIDTVRDVGNSVVGAVRDVGQMMGVGPQPDRQYDGMLVGARWNVPYPPGTPLDQIPAMEPRRDLSPGNPDDLPEAGRTVLYVNGMVTDLAGQAAEMQHIANSTGMRVIGIHNSTEGLATDLAQCGNDKLAMAADLLEGVTGVNLKGTNPAVDTLANTMYTELMAGRDVHVMGYSQGALITARALRDLANRLRIEDGLPQAQVEQIMSRINVETFGGAGAIFPDGPNYVHYVNKWDIVPMSFGQGNAWDPLRHGGRGAVVHEFLEGGLLRFGVAHDLDDTYLKHRVPFEDARSGNF